MDFDYAWKYREEDEELADKKTVVEAEILFDCSGYGPGTATMVISDYYKDKDAAGVMLKRAWKTFCKGKPGMDASIRLLTVYKKKIVDNPKNANNKIVRSA